MQNLIAEARSLADMTIRVDEDVPRILDVMRGRHPNLSDAAFQTLGNHVWYQTK